MLAQSFVFKLLDLKKSSRAFLMFFAFLLFYSVEVVCVDHVLLVLTQRSDLGELMNNALVLRLLDRDHIMQSPIAKGRPTFDGPPGNEARCLLERDYIMQSPIAKGRPTFDGPPGNEKCVPSFDPGPPGNE